MHNSTSASFNAALRDTDRFDADDAAATKKVVVRSFGATDKGQVRERNEDHFLIASLIKTLDIEQTSLPRPVVEHSVKQSSVEQSSERGHIFVVADGVGGHAAGERASALAIASIERFVLDTFKWFFQFQGHEEDELLAEFQAAIERAHLCVADEGEQHAELAGMATTLTLAYSLQNDLFVAHVGDSRCYLMQQDAFNRVTHDHTVVEELLRSGRITPENAANHRLRHVVTNAVGGGFRSISVEVHKRRLSPGDTLLLCTDGLTEMLEDNQIAAVLRASADPQAACERLIAEANEEGGRDNVTAIVARYDAA
jgi:protein phosphatase